ncbi:DUF2889 domain-containing protein [Variovorax saccharolyticus]|uniref:DUF2889 domain-containing protein n=1 Tax=Variovorax saccharolyticus TaxID=3053516 RepID=UPI0025775EB8|nr:MULTISPECIES: DUF2889 domain-containing protein [unclassified Variovorax]MDM0021168.1 DUF2889 domain-containing protein [Variovorax sp. J22R187]MDM0025542.1 DUF2889 domain-containing protein [Variovorax sp. J31P216]
MDFLPPHPCARRLLHTREIVCRGYLRDDGLFDIEGSMRDLSAEGSDLYFKTLRAGDELHAMRITMTVDDALVIRHLRVHTDAAPTPYCADSNPAYRALEGLVIGPGFTRKARDRVGGTRGCTHLTELLGPLATTAMQTLFAHKREAGGLRATHALPGKLPKPSLADTCQAYRADGEAIRIIWPPERRMA